METGSKQINALHDFVDEAHEPSSALSCHLSIQISLDGFSFCILNLENNKYLVLKSYLFSRIFSWDLLAQNVERIVKQDDLLAKKYKSVSAVLINNQFTIVPSPLFDITKQKDYLKFNADFGNSSIISNDTLKSIEAKNVYAIPREMDKTIRRNFGTCMILHNTSSLIENLINSNKNNSENQLFVNVNTSSFDLLLIKNNKLEFCNTFAYRTNEDFIYYLLFVCEQLKLNPENINLVLSGEIEKNTSRYTMLYNYVRNIRFASRSDRFKYSYKLDEIPAHFYYNLLNQYPG